MVSCAYFLATHTKGKKKGGEASGHHCAWFLLSSVGIHSSTNPSIHSSSIHPPTHACSYTDTTKTHAKQAQKKNSSSASASYHQQRQASLKQAPIIIGSKPHASISKTPASLTQRASAGPAQRTSASSSWRQRTKSRFLVHFLRLLHESSALTNYYQVHYRPRRGHSLSIHPFGDEKRPGRSRTEQWLLFQRTNVIDSHDGSSETQQHKASPRRSTGYSKPLSDGERFLLKPKKQKQEK